MSVPSPLLMIPGPIEISPAVLARFGAPPPGHQARPLIEAFGSSLERMREIWLAAPESQPFVVGGGGTLAMEMAAWNLVEPGDRAVVVNTGYFSSRLAEMFRRAGAVVREVETEVGTVPPTDRVAQALSVPTKILAVTHVDTSTGVRVDPEPMARLALERGALSVFDGVCATAAERFEMARIGADVYLTASQKAIGLPPGLALMVASARALEARDARRAVPPPTYLDWHEWLPVMRAYEERRPSYFSTPPTNLVLALDTGLAEILEQGIEARFRLHERVSRGMRAAWSVLGLAGVPASETVTAHTLSALRFPEGVDAGIVPAILKRGVVVAGGLHPAILASYFRVGHMGYAATRMDWLGRTVEAVGEALREAGAAVDPAAAVCALHESLATDAARS